MERSKMPEGKHLVVSEAAFKGISMENPNNSESAQERHALPTKEITSTSREEGELSTSDDDENQPHCSTSQFTGVNAAELKPLEVELVKDAHDIEAGRCASSNTLAKLSSQASQESKFHKSSDKNRGSFVPFLISFSDDESGSDPEGTAQKNTLIRENRCLSVNTSSKLPQAEAAARRPLKLGKVIKNEARVMKKLPLTHQFVSSSHKNSTVMARRGGLTLNVRNNNNFKQTNGPSLLRKTNTTLNNSKLQDLRQLIAIRENELKLKGTQQVKSFSSTECKDLSVMGTCISMRGFSGATGAENMSHESKEPTKKRQKIDENHSSQMVQNSQVTDTLLPSEKSVSENCGQPGLGGQSSHGEMFERPHAGLAIHHEHENQGSMYLTKLPTGRKAGTDLLTSQSGRKTNLRDCMITSAQAAVANDSEVELKGPTKHSHQFIPGPGQAGKSCTGRSPSDPVALDDQPHPHVTQNVNQEPLNIQQVPHNFRKVNMSRNSGMDLQSLLDTEELHDKQLEEAQEYRRKCEIEERNALNSYRKAQKALIEANARCSALFSKREIYSAQLRRLMIENPVYPNTLFPLGSHIETDFNPSTNYGANRHLMLSSCCPAQLDCDGRDHQMRDAEFHSAFEAMQNASDMHVDDREKVTSDPFSEPDVSTSELNKVNHKESGVCLQADDISMSAEEEDGLLQRSPQNSSEYQGEGAFGVVQEKEANDVPERQLAMDSSRDTLLLEASLRSQLFERLKMKALPKKVGGSPNVETITESLLEVDDFGRRMGLSSGNISSSDVEKEKASDFPVSSDKADIEYDTPVEINDRCNNDTFGSNFSSMLSTSHLSSCMSIDEQHSQSSNFATFSLPAFRSAFSHLKHSHTTNFGKPQIRGVNIQASHVNNANDDETPGNTFRVDEYASLDLHSNKNGSYSCEFAIDPLWPLCMYELRGKCNDIECTWQHFRDYSSEAKKNTTCNNRDLKDESTIRRGKSAFTNALTMSNVSAPPTYLVGFDVTKVDLQTYKSAVAQKKCFSGFLVLSSLLLTDLTSKEPFLYGSEAHVEVHGGWNRQLLYFQSRNGTSIEGGHQFSDDDQSIELALLSLCQEGNKSKGRIQALKVLARALEACPTSAALWIVYLLIYYSNQKCIGKDDMFKHAVEHSKESYELWVLYINSRETLDERLTAYDAAISSLCQNISNRDAFASECILDLTLQMMNFLAMSGNIGKAIEKINDLFSTTNIPNNPHNNLFFPDIIPRLTISDKCIFWVCCVYIVVYRRLPDSIANQLESQKELSSIEWPPTQLTTDEKQQVVSLMELAVDSLVLHIDRESLEDELNLSAAHLFALNHVKFVAVLEGIDCGRNLLERYKKLYPSSLELALMSARVEHEFQDSRSYEGFEEALGNWIDEVPGVQCVWNQYTECVFRDGRLDIVKELIDRWFRSNDLPESGSISDVSSWLSSFTQTDVVFGLLNYAIYKLLMKNDPIEARMALNKALDAADNTECYNHCVRELIMFLITSADRSALQVVKGYLFDARASSPVSDPLTRNFIRNLKKPRLRQLAGKLLSPIPSDPTLVNSILKSWFGPSLLPCTTDKLTDMVDFVESLMEILPSNYPLAISVCKWVSSRKASFSASVSFWAGSLLSNALFQAVPVAPEYVWAEAASLLICLMNCEEISISFHRSALSIYPFSIKLWKSYVGLSTSTGELAKEAAKEKGIPLDEFLCV
ncbi:unnamed protein product [Cuscuta europaea]|uniref:Putative zinc-finger domain-containing protein n=1 Tax=Cuscuta europaea TaxID=41803 RepID=A0A9P0ZT69_CUSEU|nr:unnamed protein product [Cuscuta europaea]